MIKKIILQAVTLIAAFVLTVFLTNKWKNAGMDEVSAEMDRPTLPLVYMIVGEREINCLHGYTSSIDVSLFHDSITPVGTDKSLKFRLENLDMEFNSVGYEVRSVDGESLIENGSVDDLEKNNGSFYATTTLRMDLSEMEEYSLVLYVQLKSNRTVRYYTRLLVSDELYTDRFLEFVQTFHDATFDKEKRADITPYIEPDDTGENENLSHIGIHSNYETFTWANLSVMRISQMVPTMKEIDAKNAVIELKYVAISGDETDTQYYNVTEEYRLRYVDSKTIYLMDYDRKMENIFDRFNVNTSKNWFFLGIADLDQFRYKYSDDNKKVAFVREGQLWYYDYSKTEITKVFGFWQDSPTDVRSAYGQHGINIVKLDDEGNIIFTVYGYMNRGRHEGENGIAVYQFDTNTSRLTEVLFLACDEPYEILKENASELNYLNEKGEFFYLVGNNVMKLNIETGESSYLIHNMFKEYLAVSESESLIAYPNESLDINSTELTILNLETYEEHLVKAGSGERIKAVGFIGEDLAYGLAHQEDVIMNTDSSTIFPMHKLRITTIDDQVLKEYDKGDLYVMQASTKNRVIYMKRARKVGNTYIPAADDFITYKEEDSDGIQVVYQYTYDGYNQMYMIFPDYMYVTSVPQLEITKEVLNDKERNIMIDSGEKSNRYYVYAQGRMQQSYSSPRDAVLAAYETGGTAINSYGQSIWKISGLLEYAEVTDGLIETRCDSVDESLQECIEMLLRYEKLDVPDTYDLSGNIDEIIERYTGKVGINLVGCDVDNALYYLCQGAPIITKVGENYYVLIISYNETTIRYYDPVDGAEHRQARYILERTFENQGSQFYTYIK